MRIVGVSSILSLSLILGACGTQSDPRAKYNVESVPLHDQPVDVKKVYKDANLFTLKVPSGNMNFVEGQTASYSIEVATQYPNASYRLKSANLPDGAVFAPVSGKKNLYKLTWTPAIGTLPDGKASDTFKFTIDVEVDAKSTNSDTSKLREIAGPGYETLTVTLNKTAENPTFESVQLASKEVSAADQNPVAITVVAKAPGVPADNTLTLDIEDPQWSSNEVAIVKAKKAVTFQAPERSGDTFKFVGSISTKDLEIPAKKKSIQARFLMRLENKAMGRKSTVETVNLTILPVPEPAPTPKPKPTPKPSPTPKPAATPKATPAPTATPAPAATATPAPAASATPVASPAPAASATPAPTATPKPAAKPTPKPTATPKKTTATPPKKKETK
jgi:hypothetical protein